MSLNRRRKAEAHTAFVDEMGECVCVCEGGSSGAHLEKVTVTFSRCAGEGEGVIGSFWIGSRARTQTPSAEFNGANAAQHLRLLMHH